MTRSFARAVLLARLSVAAASKVHAQAESPAAYLAFDEGAGVFAAATASSLTTPRRAAP